MSEPPEEFGQALVYLSLLFVVLGAFTHTLLDELKMYNETSVDWEQSGFHLAP